VPDQPVKPLILAVDTTHEYGSLALAEAVSSEPGACLHTVEELLLHAPSGFAHILYDHLAALLARHSIRTGDIACFAAASGPGSFTGVRVGLSCVKGLAEAVGRPAVGVSNLQALACFGTGPRRATVLDARRGEIYGAVYDDALRLILPEVVAPFPAWLDTLPEGPIEFISTDFQPFESAFGGTRFEHVRRTVAPRVLAPAIARIAFIRYKCGEAQDPAALDANYVRRSDAELFWKE
jgi:tRNA threonylcarbamoyladenosine biosynthesis protein TsaB